MPIPKHKSSGVIPPYEGDVTGRKRSPYLVSLVEVAGLLCTTEQRKKIFLGFLDYRKGLRDAGIAQAVQWLDGSFVEALEREPNDVDVVTFCMLLDRNLPGAAEQTQKLTSLLTTSKAAHRVDGYFVVVNGGNMYTLVRETVYWYSLFSHRRASAEWKGLVEVTLSQSDDDTAAKQAAEEACSRAKTQ